MLIEPSVIVSISLHTKLPATPVVPVNEPLVIVIDPDVNDPAYAIAPPPVSVVKPVHVTAELATVFKDAVAPERVNIPADIMLPERLPVPLIVKVPVVLKLSLVFTVLPVLNVIFALLLSAPIIVVVVDAFIVNVPVTKLLPAVVIVALAEKTRFGVAVIESPLTRVMFPAIVVVIAEFDHVRGVVKTSDLMVAVAVILKTEATPPVLVTVTAGCLVAPGVSDIFPEPPSSRFVEPNWVLNNKVFAVVVPLST